LKEWNIAVSKFGLGQPTGVDLPGEKAGNLPSVEYYDRIYGINRWKFSNFYSVSIGQGEVQVTPMQMANLSAIIANKGFYYTPHIVKEIAGQPKADVKRIDVGVRSQYFEPVIEGMAHVVVNGTGRRAFIEDIEVCGKTSTVENPHGEDHSGFMAFAPKTNPRIAVSAYVENAGQGARAAASAASLVIEKYLNGEIKRTNIEEYFLRGEFGDVAPKKQTH
jgi:penicillin-binding protein 2